MKGMGTRQERETVIVFNDDEDTASVWTASETVYRRLKKRGYFPVEDNERSAKFEVTKGEVKLPRPKKRKTLTPEQRETAAQSLRNARFSRAAP